MSGGYGKDHQIPDGGLRSDMGDRGSRCWYALVFCFIYETLFHIKQNPAGGSHPHEQKYCFAIMRGAASGSRSLPLVVLLLGDFVLQEKLRRIAAAKNPRHGLL